MTISEEIDKFIEGNSSNTGDPLLDTRDALNVCMARLKLLQNAIVPDWSTAPDWANWLAQDADGSWYSDKPKLSVDVWQITGKFQQISLSESIGWETSLQQRPEKQEQCVSKNTL